MTLLDRPWPEEPRLAELYDVECAGRWDHDFYLDLAARLQVDAVVDIGCGTGVFAVDASQRGWRAAGVDPASAVLDIARNRAGGSVVTWVERVADVPTASADLVIMMGHVAQYFVSDESWSDVLREARRVLGPAGHLAFETRNPSRDWANRWTRARTEETLPHPNGGTFTSWVEVQQIVAAGESFTITHEGNTLLPDGSHLRAAETLRFRSPDEVLESLSASGFAVVETWGDWDRSPYDEASDEFIVLARSSVSADHGR